MSMKSQIDSHEERLRIIESRFPNLNYDFKHLVTSEFDKRWKFIPQAETYYGVYIALCVDTKDPHGLNRIRVWSPALCQPNAQIEALPWALPCSPLGGFDDGGMVAVPPAGSQVVVMFIRGSRDLPVWFGTTWQKTRGSDEKQDETNQAIEGHLWNHPVPEYTELYDGERGGNFYIGDNSGSQAYPPWNTDNYQDIDADISYDILKKNKPQPPSEFGMKTTQKHMLKLVDGRKGDHYNGKRIELMSSLGNYFLLKDDFLRPEEWPNPKSGAPHAKNKYFKEKNECWPHIPGRTPQNNGPALHNTGMQLLSRGGGTIIIDDRVGGLPDGIPEWQQCLPDRKYDFGEKCLGKIKIISQTGHRFEQSDVEDIPENRGPNNYTRLLTPCGNVIELNDHTIDGEIAGWKRGITMQSTSRHRFEMIDYLNEHASPIRAEMGRPEDEGDSQVEWEGRANNKATAAWIRLQSGYGLLFEMCDFFDQRKTDQQYVQILTPNKTCTDCGPHFMRFQELCTTGPNQEKKSEGFVWLKVAGYYLCQTCKDHVTIVGDKETYPSNKITVVTKNTLIATEEDYMNIAQLHYFHAEEFIFLLAGQDCPVPGQEKKEPCIMPILVMHPKSGQIFASDRVYGSASPDAPPVSILQFLPFYTPKKNEETEEV